MKAKRTSITTCSVILMLLFGLFFVQPARADEGNISPTDKYAWAENAGWLNFRPADGGVTVYPDHLEGYAWAENVGWVKLGADSGGGDPYYANTNASNWGVNHDGVGNLWGYAWSETVGWINFAPPGGGVTIDPATGEFDGYAWAENVGWIHVKNTNPLYASYNVATAGADDVELVKTQEPLVDRGTDPETGNPFVWAGDTISYTLTAENFFDTAITLLISDAVSSFVEYVAETLDIYEAGAQFAGDIDMTDKYAWAENAGWINFRPTNGGIRVYADHLTGYAWAENIGWVKLGGPDGGGTPSYYTNDSGTTWGVNHDGSGNLSGYAWSETVGWINFAPPGGGVTINLATGEFDGYAWAENVGWIHFQNKPVYMVVKTMIDTFFSGGLLDYTSGLLDPGEALVMTFDVLVSDLAPLDALIWNTAEIAYIGGLQINKPSNTVTAEVVPEPTTIALAGIGLCGLLTLGWKSRKMRK